MGIQSLYVSGVENVLERPCDPLLIGTLLHDHGEIAAKCVDAYRENEDFNRYISVNGRIKSYSPKTISDMTMDARVKKSPIALNSVVYDTAYLNKLLSNHQLRFEISRLYFLCNLVFMSIREISVTLMSEMLRNCTTMKHATYFRSTLPTFSLLPTK